MPRNQWPHDDKLPSIEIAGGPIQSSSRPCLNLTTCVETMDGHHSRARTAGCAGGAPNRVRFLILHRKERDRYQGSIAPVLPVDEGACRRNIGEIRVCTPGNRRCAMRYPRCSRQTRLISGNLPHSRPGHSRFKGTADLLPHEIFKIPPEPKINEPI